MASSYELITISPTKPQTPSLAAKRTITPSPELRSPKKRLILTPVGRVSDGDIVSPWVIRKETSIHDFSPYSTNICLENKTAFGHSHAHPHPPQSLPRTNYEHVILPFDLKTQPDAFKDESNKHLVLRLFPDTTGLSFDGFLVIYFSKLPPTPWPRVIAGVPCYSTTDIYDQGPLGSVLGFPGRSKIHVATELDGQNLESNWEKLFVTAKNFFDLAQISITEIQYWSNFLAVVLEDDNPDLAKLPRKIGHCNCFYHFEKDMRRPQHYPALRSLNPSDDQADSSQYQLLRPGVMLGSEKDPQNGIEMLTSSGVLVRHDQTGERFITVASHGFPNGHKVYHPSCNGKEIGKLVHNLPHTDISLVELQSSIQYINETFQTSTMSDPPVRFRGLAKVDETRPGDFAYMESPFNGYMEGTFGTPAFIRLPADDPNQSKQSWIRARWDYMGQGFGGEVKAGVCGSAIWNEDLKVVGFFRYMCQEGMMKDWCFSVAAECLIEKGYSLVVES